MRRILIVCLGNICRSPAAEGVLRAKAAGRGLALEIASAGTGGWHRGDAPDARMIAACARRGYDISHQRARQISASELQRHDLMLAMDRKNLADLIALAPGRARNMRLFLDFAGSAVRETPDPYYGDAAAFERALDLIETGADAVLDHLEGASG